MITIFLNEGAASGPVAMKLRLESKSCPAVKWLMPSAIPVVVQHGSHQLNAAAESKEIGAV